MKETGKEKRKKRGKGGVVTYSDAVRIGFMFAESRDARSGKARSNRTVRSSDDGGVAIRVRAKRVRIDVSSRGIVRAKRGAVAWRV